MTLEDSLPPVTEDELLARFVLHRNRVRADLTVKPDAFIPHPQPGLSMTRHRGISEQEIWELGQSLARFQSRELYGRADVVAGEITRHRLSIVPTHEPKNHVNVVGWPEKAAQKIIAQEIAARARYLQRPV